LLEFRGALVLVTHDRYMLDRVSTIVLGFDGLGSIERFADYSQWDAWQEERQAAHGKIEIPDASARGRAAVAAADIPTAPAKKKLSYKEERELESMEQRIAEAEQLLHERQAALQDTAIMSDGPRLHSASLLLDEARQAVDKLYARWAELEKKKG
jgi:ATP-binding cassette subfamily F protein uup